LNQKIKKAEKALMAVITTKKAFSVGKKSMSPVTWNIVRLVLDYRPGGGPVVFRLLVR